MKGFEWLSLLYITLVGLLIIMVFAVPNLGAAIQSAAKNSAHLTAIEIAGIINTEESSPSYNIKYTMKLPSSCNIKITRSFVQVENGDTKSVAEIIGTSVIVSQKEIDCTKQKSITIEKNGGRIEVT